MIQDIAPWRLRNEFQDLCPLHDDLVFDIDENGLLLLSGDGRPPLVQEWRNQGNQAELLYAFCLAGDEEAGTCGQQAAGRAFPALPAETRGEACGRADEDAPRSEFEGPASLCGCSEPKSPSERLGLHAAFSRARGLSCFLPLRQRGEPSLAPEGWQRIAPSALRGESGPLPLAAATALHLARWYDTHRFCGRCGSVLRRSGTERALLCPSCGLASYPVIAPCVLVAVTHNDSILLTRYARPGASRLVLVAGFVEIGETAEQAAAREVMEETGLRIKNLRYAGSQPWGFSGSLAAGFVAELDGPDAIRIDTSELAEARWVKRTDIPPCPDESSLTMTMITRFARGEL